MSCPYGQAPPLTSGLLLVRAFPWPGTSST